VNESVRILVRVLARQAARECFDRELALMPRHDSPQDIFLGRDRAE